MVIERIIIKSDLVVASDPSLLCALKHLTGCSTVHSTDSTRIPTTNNAEYKYALASEAIRVTAVDGEAVRVAGNSVIKQLV